MEVLREMTARADALSSRRWRGWAIGVGLSLMIGVASCANQPLHDRASPPPGWLDVVQRSSGELCAVGVSGPTHYVEDAQTNSKANAITELARAVRVTVQSELVIRQQGTNRRKVQVDVDDTSSQKSHAVLERAQVYAQWINPGDYPMWGTKGTVYTWACLPSS